MKVIGPTIDPAIPVKAYTMRSIEKLGAKMQPTVDAARRHSPPRSRDLGLKRRLRALIRRADTTPTMEAAVLICPVTQTSCPKDKPMSMRRRLVRIPGGIVAKRDITKDGRTIRPGFSTVLTSVSLILLTDHAISA